MNSNYLKLSYLTIKCVFVCNLLFVFSCVSAQSETPIFPNLLDDELLEEIIDAYKPTSVLNYATAKDLMYSTIYKEKDSVRCVYSGHMLFLPINVDPSIFLYMNGSSNGINAEHTYPRSKGASDGNAHSDMHHLFPTRSPINSSRSNFPFGEIDDNQTTTWFHLDNSEGALPSTNIDLYSERIDGRFEPREDHKGNVARAIFYFFTMYKDEALDADPEFFELQRQTLCEWHLQDPVDSLEWKRTFMIADYQNDLPNPYILDSSLALRAFCDGEVSTSVEKVNDTGLLVYPNPTTDYLKVISDGNSKLKVMDIYGNMIIQEYFSNSIEVDFSSLNSGNYLVTVNGKVNRILKL